jgi:uncharacterized damage-inducible protein DinB
MSFAHNFSRFATYNQWMNKKLYEAAATLSSEQLVQNRGAFFGSVIGTLNHIVVADIIWLKRIANYFPNLESLKSIQEMATPTSLDQQLFTDIENLSKLRASLDEIIINLCAELSQHELNSAFEYFSTKGIKGNKLLGEVLLHFLITKPTIEAKRQPCCRSAVWTWGQQT